jgi:hypothetical protein
VENRRGRWYLLSLISFPILFLALKGYFGEEAQEESQVALADLGNAIYRLRFLLVALFAAVVAVLVFELR